MKMPSIIWIALAAGCLLPSLGWPEIRGAKAIFASGEGPTVMLETPDSSAPTHSVRQLAKARRQVTRNLESQQERYVGFSYWMELVSSDGEPRRVTTDQAFRSGDRIRLNLVSNWDSYLYVVNVDSTGRSQLLFPHLATSARNHLIKGNTRYEVPPGAYIRFDDNPGEETILIMLSPAPLSEIPPLPSPQTQALSTEDTARLAVMAYLNGTKDLLLEVDTASPQPASYVVAPLSMLESAGQMISLQVQLKRQ
jgi:hypothetical protein